MKIEGRWNTDYSYDLLNNLTLINHGGQSRAFTCDNLSCGISKTRVIDSRNYTTLYEYNRGT